MDAFLQQFTPAEFDERYAAETADGEPAEWVDRICEILKRGFSLFAMSRKFDIESLDPLKPRDDYEPISSSPFEAPTEPRSMRPTAPVQDASPAQASALFAAAFGPPDQRKGA